MDPQRCPHLKFWYFVEVCHSRLLGSIQGWKELCRCRWLLVRTLCVWNRDEASVAVGEWLFEREIRERWGSAQRIKSRETLGAWTMDLSFESSHKWWKIDCHWFPDRYWPLRGHLCSSVSESQVDRTRLRTSSPTLKCRLFQCPSGLLLVSEQRGRARAEIIWRVSLTNLESLERSSEVLDSAAHHETFDIPMKYRIIVLALST